MIAQSRSGGRHAESHVAAHHRRLVHRRHGHCHRHVHRQGGAVGDRIAGGTAHNHCVNAGLTSSHVVQDQTVRGPNHRTAKQPLITQTGSGGRHAEGHIAAHHRRLVHRRHGHCHRHVHRQGGAVGDRIAGGTAHNHRVNAGLTGRHVVQRQAAPGSNHRTAKQPLIAQSRSGGRHAESHVAAHHRRLVHRRHGHCHRHVHRQGGAVGDRIAGGTAHNHCVNAGLTSSHVVQDQTVRGPNHRTAKQPLITQTGSGRRHAEGYVAAHHRRLVHRRHGHAHRHIHRQSRTVGHAAADPTDNHGVNAGLAGGHVVQRQTARGPNHRTAKQPLITQTGSGRRHAEGHVAANHRCLADRWHRHCYRHVHRQGSAVGHAAADPTDNHCVNAGLTGRHVIQRQTARGSNHRTAKQPLITQTGSGGRHAEGHVAANHRRLADRRHGHAHRHIHRQGGAVGHAAANPTDNHGVNAGLTGRHVVQRQTARITNHRTAKQPLIVQTRSGRRHAESYVAAHHRRLADRRHSHCHRHIHRQSRTVGQAAAGAAQNHAVGSRVASTHVVQG